MRSRRCRRRWRARPRRDGRVAASAAVRPRRRAAPATRSWPRSGRARSSGSPAAKSRRPACCTRCPVPSRTACAARRRGRRLPRSRPRPGGHAAARATAPSRRRATARRRSGCARTCTSRRRSRPTPPSPPCRRRSRSRLRARHCGTRGAPAWCSPPARATAVRAPRRRAGLRARSSAHLRP